MVAALACIRTTPCLGITSDTWGACWGVSHSARVIEVFGHFMCSHPGALHAVCPSGEFKELPKDPGGGAGTSAENDNLGVLHNLHLFSLAKILGKSKVFI